ncbi:TniQ family protein [Agrobacterium rosae]|uniref:TniQ family protein n=1 Tax=Agrobacterium rosae TaxID=1972867 RepID=UPI002A132B84|nr:TniQ family protein [Agrobacterium rosae]MDX8316368.1 TniQ family protein [Agrobacterium rosae]
MPEVFPILHAETLLGFVSRYAVRRGVRCADFMRHTGISLFRYSSFDTAVDRLAALTGNSPEVLAQHALRLENVGFHRLCGERIYRNNVYRKSARYCPMCVVQDHAKGGPRPFTNIFCRASWLVDVLTVCPHHGVSMRSSPNLFRGYAHEDFNGNIIDRWKEIVAEATNAEMCGATKFDAYFHARLNGDERESEILDTLPYYGALGICEVVGAMELGEGTVGRSKMSGSQRREAFNRGFDLLNLGYPSLTKFLEKRDSRRRETNDKGVGKQLYGIFYTYLNERVEDPGYSELISFVKNHAFSAHPIGPENNFLGGGGERKFHSIRSASMQYGMHPATLRKMLHAAHLLDADSDLRDLKVSIPVAAMDDIARRWKEGVPAYYLKERFETSPQVVKQLTDAKILVATNREVNHRLKSFYSLAQVEAFISQLERLAEVDDSTSIGTVPLKHCAPFMTYVDIIRNVLDKKLRIWIRKPSNSGTTFAHLRVNEDEVRILAGIGLPEGHYGTGLVAARLALRVGYLQTLEAIGLLEVSLFKGPNGIMTKAYPKASVNAFTKRFISFRKLARGRNNWEKTERRVAGLVPAFDFGGVDRLFLKTDVFR